MELDFIGISQSLILTLSFSNVPLEFLVKFIEICDTCVGRCKVTLGMNGEIWMIILLAKKGGTESIVVEEGVWNNCLAGSYHFQKLKIGAKYRVCVEVFKH